MKRYLSILLAAVMIFTIGCGKDTTKDKENKDTKANPTVTITTAPTQSAEPMQTTEPTETPSTTATVSVSPAPTESADATQEALASTPTLVPSVDNTQSPSASEPIATVKPTAETTVKPTSKPTATVKPTAKPTVKPTAKPTVKPTAEPTPTEEEQIAYYRRLAAETVEEINKLRNVQLIVLPGLTKYAEYRAKQLETNFAHDSADQKAASKALQYGKYTNTPPSQAVLDVLLQYNPNYVYEPSYFVPAAEAITTGLGELAAASLRRSPGHWSYVGSDEYLYIGVGASKGGTCVCVAAENTDLLK